MGNCYSQSDQPPEPVEDEESITAELKRKMNSISYKKGTNLRSNDEILQKYKIIKQLGSGLFSKVYLAQDEFGQKAAIKIIKKKDFSTQDTIQKIVLEKEVLKLLNHDCILKLYKTVQSDSRIYFFLEYASKGNLLQLLNIKNRFEAPEVRLISAQIVEALLYIHSKGIIYGDLKAENVLINEHGLIKLCDFNLSGTKSILNDTIQGTVCYISPEIIEGKKRTKKSDFWALGVLVHLLFYRRYPFRFNNQTDLFYNIVNRNIQPETGEVRAPPSLKKFIDDLLNRDFRKRIGNSIEEFMAHPFFKDFDWKNYRSAPDKFKYIEGVPDLDEDGSTGKKDTSDIDDFRNIKDTHNPKFMYNIEGFTFENGKKDYVPRSEPNRKANIEEDFQDLIPNSDPHRKKLPEEKAKRANSHA